MNRVEIEKSTCINCTKPIHRHTNGTTWSHDLFEDFMNCGNVAMPPLAVTEGDNTECLPS